jgi:integrase
MKAERSSTNLKGNTRDITKMKMDNSKATTEWLNSRKQNVRWQYSHRWQIWLEYCTQKGIPSNGSEQLEDMKKRRLSEDNTVKYFYDNEIPRFFQWLQTEYKGKTTKKPLSESSALAVTTAIRSFFSYHRYSLEIKKEALPSSEKVEGTYQDHAFDIYQLRSMFQCGDLQERTILACGKDLWLRVGDFTNLKRDLIELTIKREQELAENEKRDIDIIEFEIPTEKEKEPCSCHLSRETTELLEQYLKTYSKTSEKLFPLTEDALNDLLRRLAEKSKITVSGRIRWHCLRKFGITLMHGKITEPVMKYMTGKHISKDLKVYIQNNRETFKAFKMIEPLISLTKQNGNGGSQLAKLQEDLQQARLTIMVLTKILEKSIPKEQIRKTMNEVAKEFGIESSEVKMILHEGEPITPDLNTNVIALVKAIQQKDLERILKENGNNH